jgi:mandelate racemase
VVRAVRRSIGDAIDLMADYNQALSVPDAITRLEALAGEGLCWIEEPTLADDFEGHAQIRRKTKIPIQMGELVGSHEMAKAIATGASDLCMDAMKIGASPGGCGRRRRRVRRPSASSHLFPEVSAQLLAVSPTSHWLEYVDWANPILREPLKVENGRAILPDRPGSGIEWDEAGVERYRAP